MYAEPLVTRSKKDDTLNRRVVFSYLQNKGGRQGTFRRDLRKVADRPGGYLRILKTGHRLGDNAEMAMIEFVDFNENMLGEAAEKKRHAHAAAAPERQPHPQQRLPQRKLRKQNNIHIFS